MKTFLKVLPAALLFGLAFNAAQAQTADAKSKKMSGKATDKKEVLKPAPQPDGSVIGEQPVPVSSSTTIKKSNDLSTSERSPLDRPVVTEKRPEASNDAIKRADAGSKRETIGGNGDTKPVVRTETPSNVSSSDIKEAGKANKAHAKKHKARNVPKGRAVGWHRNFDNATGTNKK